MRYERKQCTPEMATAIMEEHNKRVEKKLCVQRIISPATIKKYAADMTADDWYDDPNPIAFDPKGNLLNGQHRLEAVRASKKTIEFTFCYDVPPEVMPYIDTGRPRAIDQMLHMNGLICARNYTSTIRFIARVAQFNHSITLTYAEAIWMLDKLNMKDAIDAIMAKSTSLRDFQARIVAPLAYYWTVRPNKAREFAEAIFNFETKKDSAARAYMTWAKLHVGERGSDAFIRAICGALRAWDEGRTLTSLRPTQDSVEWLANMNPVLRDQIRKRIPRNR